MGGVVSNSKSNGYQLSVPTGTSSSLTWDANGNMTSVESSYCLPLWDMVGMAKENADSERSSVGSAGKVNVRMGDFTHRESRSNETQSTSQDQPYMTISDLSREKTALLPRSGSGCTYTFSFDAENRLIQITYPGTNNYSTFVYDGLGRNVSIVETSAGSVTSTKNFVWCGNDRCEQRNSSSTITAQFFRQGETISGTSYYWTKNHLGSIREMTNSGGVIQDQRTYDPFGRTMQLQEVCPLTFNMMGTMYMCRAVCT